MVFPLPLLVLLSKFSMLISNLSYKALFLSILPCSISDSSNLLKDDGSINISTSPLIKFTILTCLYIYTHIKKQSILYHHKLIDFQPFRTFLLIYPRHQYPTLRGHFLTNRCSLIASLEDSWFEWSV